MIGAELRREVSARSEQIIAWRRWFHAHPETAGEERETAAAVRRSLAELGYQPQMVGENAVWAEIGEAGPLVALRADMDALPIQEESGVPFASTVPGRMHACGHDAHTAMLLGAADYLKRHEADLRGRVRLIFQPAEEVPPGGARGLVEAGLMRGVDYVFGLHMSVTDPVGSLRLRPGPTLANADRFAVEVQGIGGHGASPHGTADAVLVAAELVARLHQVVGRMTDPFDPVALTIGTIHGGSAFNVIADRARLEGTIRTLSASTQEELRARIADMASHVAQAYGAGAELRYEYGYPVLVNDAEVVRALAGALATQSLLRIVEGEPNLAGDDFAYYLREAPGAYAFLGCRPAPGNVAGHHSPRFVIDEAALPLGTMALVQGVETLWALAGKRANR